MEQKNIIFEQLSKSYQLKNEDLIPIRIYINNNYKNVKIDFQKKDKFRCETVYKDNNDVIKILNNLKSINIPIILFINFNEKIAVEIQTLKKDENQIVLLFNNLNELSTSFQYVFEKITIELLQKIYGKIPTFINESSESQKLLNYNILVKKLKNDLGVEFEAKKIEEIFNIKLLDENQQQKHYKDVLENIKNVEKYITPNENKNNNNSVLFKEKYETSIRLLDENMKSSIFYTFIYFYILPDLRLKKAIEFYEKKK